jgi:hypothetical protein
MTNKQPTLEATTRIVLTATQFEHLRAVLTQVKWATPDETNSGKRYLYLSDDDQQLAERISTLFYRAGHDAQLELNFTQDDA